VLKQFADELSARADVVEAQRVRTARPQRPPMNERDEAP
jgi:hypothetical protein